MPFHARYVLRRDFPRRLVYRGGTVVLEIVRQPPGGDRQWLLRAKKIVPPETCVIAESRLRRIDADVPKLAYSDRQLPPDALRHFAPIPGQQCYRDEGSCARLKSAPRSLCSGDVQAADAAWAATLNHTETHMNNGTTEASQVAATRSATRSSTNDDALTQAKRELLQAEVRLAKARATVVSAEIDIKAATARLRALAK